MMNKLYQDLTNNYDISKTLRFELIPIGKTKENIEANGLLEKDVNRNIKYKNVKKYCDEYHKYFIETRLEKVELKGLEEYYELFRIEKKDEKEKIKFREIQENLRKQISDVFKKDKEYKGLFGKNLINEYLVQMYKENKEKINDISEFNRFTTYFTSYNKNRENMYSEEEKSTAISYRLINENLPKFINNMKIYNAIKDKINNNVYNELEEYIQVEKLDDIFKLNYYNDVLSEKGIELYNLIISGKAEENDKKIKGLNEYINEYNQKNQTKIPKLNLLYKQILSDRTGISFVIDSIENDSELVTLIQEYYKVFEKNKDVIVKLFSTIDKYDCSKIYINNNMSITQISQDIFGDWNKINIAIIKDYDSNYTGKAKIDTEKYNTDRKKFLKSNDAYSIEYLDSIIDKYLDGDRNYSNVKEYFSSYLEKNKYFERVESAYEECIKVFETHDKVEKELIKDEKSIEKIKELLDSIKKVQEFIKIIIPKNNSLEKDDNFYNELKEKYDEIMLIIDIYNKSRNYLTQKPFSTDKVKLNFETPTLLDGWDINKEKENLGIILIKDENYYLGIINPQNRKALENIEYTNDTKNSYKKMVYKFTPDVKKTIPKCTTQLKEVVSHFSNSDDDYILDNKNFVSPLVITRKIYDLNNVLYGKYKKFQIGYLKETNNESEYKDALYTWINFCKEFLSKYESSSIFDLSSLKKTEEYERLDIFYSELDQLLYQLNFVNVPESKINELVDIGDLYLFKIYNKDFSKYSKGKENLHTMYWKALFDKDNLERNIVKLNGKAEVFYRKASLHPTKPTHRKNEAIKNKNENNPKKSSIFEYDLIKDKRYTEDKFLFYVPITLNYTNKGLRNINETVNKKIKENDNINIIGIDRGERNLIYISVIDQNGKILKQETLNTIINQYNGVEYKTSYHDLLGKKENERAIARESWKTIENIKELKEGYLSQIIHRIVELMDEYNAIIVLEDLNTGFKNSRIKVEKQVYQKFEKQLLNKLNYLVIKGKDKLEPGGVLNAYQVASEFETFKKNGKQSGILYYIPAYCTSKIDPTTGFINLLPAKYESMEKSKSFISNFEDIRFNEKENYFEFDMNYSKFTNRPYGTREFWTLCTNSSRIKSYRNKEKNNEWYSEEIVLTDEFKKLFNKYQIDLNNIKDNILQINDKSFYIELLELIRLMVQLRNSKSGTDIDYLISPVKNAKGEFFDSRKGDSSLPLDADANGAYNIARKGLMLVNRIKKTDDENLGRIEYAISNHDWLEYVQNEDK